MPVTPSTVSTAATAPTAFKKSSTTSYAAAATSSSSAAAATPAASTSSTYAAAAISTKRRTAPSATVPTQRRAASASFSAPVSTTCAIAQGAHVLQWSKWCPHHGESRKRRHGRSIRRSAGVGVATLDLLDCRRRSAAHRVHLDADMLFCALSTLRHAFGQRIRPRRGASHVWSQTDARSDDSIAVCQCVRAPIWAWRGSGRIRNGTADQSRVLVLFTGTAVAKLDPSDPNDRNNAVDIASIAAFAAIVATFASFEHVLNRLASIFGLEGHRRLWGL